MPGPVLGNGEVRCVQPLRGAQDRLAAVRSDGGWRQLSHAAVKASPSGGRTAGLDRPFLEPPESGVSTGAPANKHPWALDQEKADFGFAEGS